MFKKMFKNLLMAIVFSVVVTFALSAIAFIIVKSVPYTGNLMFYLFMGVGLYFIAKHWRD